MIDFSNVQLSTTYVHKIGNKAREEGTRFSENNLHLGSELMSDLLLKYFLGPFKNEIFYNFAHSTDIELNEVFSYVSNIFEDPESILEQSKNIGRHLYEQSNHPKINGGELYVVLLKDCVVEDELVDAVGLFKTENKDTYLKVDENEDGFEIGFESGVNINKLDKGCLIFNTDKSDGYVVSIVDTKSKEAEYWKTAFLHIKAREDNYHYTQNYLTMCKNFAENNDEINTTEQVEVKNNTIQYFAEKQDFNAAEFESEVFSNPDTAQTFKAYKENYSQETDIPVADSFEISDNAVKDVKRKFRSVIKLDKNFHVYVHGNEGNIKQGFDNERNMRFYTLFYDEES